METDAEPGGKVDAVNAAAAADIECSAVDPVGIASIGKGKIVSTPVDVSVCSAYGGCSAPQIG